MISHHDNFSIFQAEITGFDDRFIDRSGKMDGVSNGVICFKIFNMIRAKQYNAFGKHKSVNSKG